MDVPRTKAPDERRGDLLDAAEAILVDNGLSELTVDEVTAKAGVAKGTFYLYFQSKEHVLAALRDRFVERLVAGQQARLDELPAGDWIGRLERWMELSIRGYLANTALHDALFLHSHDVGGDQDLVEGGRGAAHPANQHMTTLEGILRAGAEAGAFTLTSPRVTAVVLYAVMHGAADYAIDHPEHVSAEQLIAEARRLCRCLTSAV